MHGVPAHIYADTLNAEFGEHSPPFVLAESYAASEGYIAFGDALLDGALRLSSHNGIFYEFIPVEEKDKDAPTRVLAEVVEGQDYIVASPRHLVFGRISLEMWSNLRTIVRSRPWRSSAAPGEVLIHGMNIAGESDLDGPSMV